ncbi:hypothetical protein HBI56_096360 [Parastagonospora nodorum]|uniref:RIIa domain-containing protein n=1 Tax=Phaeosphaeria nodorum (strain SN15 / ATCC MYA-4574 / FGSC 10173) TaxID=321614 RepID=A0A7U2I1F0_PHANO|nr:hypothetical protein HBH56_091750 [Parastagonospora nodorum]QRC98323.1 hypothetical protein JI435_043980 [Parastagonospora nodorum SN15]KAH3936509.1 hypothetical protein HBH54_026390 [Parastagonospora nodorum]KAH3940549.1 hypothetical protein HBH53_216460 [Parastagonospora nodorum]KAH3957754.1 hypothetical protein HBH51_221260 [Parastagonospora nodorum]
MSEPSPNPEQQILEESTSTSTPLANGTPLPADIEMADSAPTPAAEQPTPTVQTAPPTPAPVEQRPAPPVSSRNSPHPTAQAPTQPIPHGSPTRVYLNQYVTPHLLEAMKHLATTEPDKPLKFLSEFLAQKSAELEG